MCFRPSEVAMKKCSACGAVNKPIATECAQCGAPLSNVKQDFDADQASLDAANTFSAPNLPNAPAVPKGPAAPAAPKAPGAPTPPGA